MLVKDHPLYRDDEIVRQRTRDAVAAGHRILQIYKLGDGGTEHVGELLRRYDFPIGAIVADIGCGIGEVAWFMQANRPDLRFWLQNFSAAQMDMVDTADLNLEGQTVSDMHDSKLPSAHFDAVMLNYVLGHAEPRKLFAEMARILKPGGKMVMWDVMSSLPAEHFESVMLYRVHDPRSIRLAAIAAGFVGSTETLIDAEADLVGLVSPIDRSNLLRCILPVIGIFELRR